MIHTEEEEECRDWYEDNEDRVFRKDVHGQKSKKGKVFVIHGRNLPARDSIFHFLRSLSLTPIEWSQAVALTNEGAPFIGKVLESAFSNVQAIVVLITGDDEVRLRNEFINKKDPDYERNLYPQARPNVLFEAGMAFGLHPKRTVLVEIGIIKPFSDIAGRHLIRLDNSPEKRNEFVARLKTAGCSVDTIGTDWLKTGNFELKNIMEINTTIEPKPSENHELNEIQCNILQLLSSFEQSRPEGLFDTEIASLLNIQITTLKYYLELLKKSQYVYDQLVMGRPPKYQLKQKGRAFLIENNLIK